MINSKHLAPPALARGARGWYDDRMTMNLNPDATMIADAALRLQYDDIATSHELRAFAESFEPITNRSLRAALIDIIDLDLRDMIHNCNLDFYLTADEIDTLTDEQFDALADHLRDTFDAAMIADKLLARFDDLDDHFTADELDDDNR